MKQKNGWLQHTWWLHIVAGCTFLLVDKTPFVGNLICFHISFDLHLENHMVLMRAGDGREMSMPESEDSEACRAKLEVLGHSCHSCNV